MAVKIRLKRMGKIRAPYYRIVVTDSRTKRDGRVIEEIGIYHPTQEPSVIEVKSELVSVEATLRKLDEKVRLTIDSIAETRFGERPRAVARLLVLPSSTTERRRVARHDDVLGVGLPRRGKMLRAWLRRPAGPIRGILFVADTNPGGTRRG